MNNNVIDISIIAKDLASNVIKRVNNNIQSASKSINKAFRDNMARGAEQFNESLKSLAMGGLAIAGSAMLAFGGYAVKTFGETEQLKNSLAVALNGTLEKTNQKFQELAEFAKKTPLSLTEVTRSFIKLKNMGLDPSDRALTSYGDTAAAMGKSLNDMVEAVADATTGEFERLKEFGIRSSVEGDRVKFTFKGVTTEVGKNSQEIEKYLIKLGETNFAGGMAKQSQSLFGILSTLVDNVNAKINEFFDQTKLGEDIKNFFKGISDSIENINLSEKTQLLTSFYESSLKPFIDFLIQNKDATVFAISAIGIAITASLIGPMIAAAAPMATFIAVLALIGTAAFVLKKAWDENFLGIRDTLTNVWTNSIQPKLNELWKTFNEKLKPSIDRFVTETWPKISQEFEKSKPFIEMLVKLIGERLSKDFETLAKGIEIAMIGFGRFLDFINNNYDKFKRFADILLEVGNALKNIQTGNLEGIKSSMKNLGVPGFATGTNYAPGGLAMVGERGPELVHLPRGSKVRTANETSQELSGMGGGVSITNNYYNNEDPQAVSSRIAFQVRNLSLNY